MPLSSFGGWLAGTPPSDLGVSAGVLKPCPDTPNCVSSQASGKHFIRPIPFDAEPTLALQLAHDIVRTMPRTRIVERTANYIRAEILSRLFGFVDDLELYLDADRRVLHVRSAARIGYSDLGVNRRRVEQFRAEFIEAQRAR